MRGLTPIEFEVLHRRVTDAPREITYDQAACAAAAALSERGLIREQMMVAADGGLVLRPEITTLGALAYRLELAVRRGAP